MHKSQGSEFPVVVMPVVGGPPMLMARNLIVNTKEKISAIASSVGYSQLNNFYVHFKSYFNVSPSSLRRYSSAVGADEPEEAET